MKIKSKILDHSKTSLCNWLNACVREWPIRRVKLVGTIFIVISSGISVFVASKGIFGNPDFSLFKRNQSQEPILPRSYPDYHLERTQLLHTKIEHMKRYLDSLSLHDTSRYQAILKANPKRLENIQSVESLFNQSNKK